MYYKTAKKHIVVIGGGFAGLNFCLNCQHPNARITLLDKQNHHLFVPLLYQVATTGLSAPDIAQPLRSVLSKRKDVDILMLEAKDIDMDKRVVHTDGESLPFDYLVLAMGSRTNYFGNTHWGKYAMGLKTLGDAHRIRDKIIRSFELAEAHNTKTHDKKRLMNTVVIGAGPTGVEMAGTLAELYKKVFEGDYRNIRPEYAKITLVDALPEVLPAFSDESSNNAREQLSDLEVKVITGKMVKDIRKGEVILDDMTLEAENIIWTAGVSASDLTQSLDVDKNKGGQIYVNQDCSVPNNPHVFAIGDTASLKDANGRVVPGLAPAAIQMGKHVGKLLQHELINPKSKRDPFRYRDKGMLATIGRGKAVGEIKDRKFRGRFAWFVWLTVHLAFLRGLRNRLFVLLQWMFAYITFKPGARIIWDKYENLRTNQEEEDTTMSEYKRSAHVIWKGNLSEGSGTINSESKTINEAQYRFGERVTEDNKETNPEELLAATTASCFAMALSKTIEDDNADPAEIDVDADVTLNTDSDPKVTGLKLRVGALVPDYNEENLRQSVEKTLDTCPMVQLIKPGLEYLDTETRVLKMAS